LVRDERIAQINAVIFFAGKALAFKAIFKAFALATRQHPTRTMYLRKPFSRAAGTPRRAVGMKTRTQTTIEPAS